MRTQARLLVTTALALGLAACANFSSTLSADARPDGDHAYLYARLTLTGEAGQGFCHLRAGLTIEQLDGSGSYNMEFDPDVSVVAIPVKPGTYRLRSLLFARCDSYVAGERLIPPSELLAKSFTVKAGTAYYVADMVVQAGMSSNAAGTDAQGAGPVGQSEMTWQLVSATDNYSQTTRDFNLRYPRLAMLPTAGSIRPRP